MRLVGVERGARGRPGWIRLGHSSGSSTKLVGPIAEDPADLRAHVGEPAAVRHVGIGHVDVDRGRDVLDEHPEARGGLVGLADRLVEDRARVAEAPHEGQAGDEDDDDAAEPERGERGDRGPSAGAEGADASVSAARPRAPPNNPTTAPPPDAPNRLVAMRSTPGTYASASTPDYHRFGPSQA